MTKGIDAHCAKVAHPFLFEIVQIKYLHLLKSFPIYIEANGKTLSKKDDCLYHKHPQKHGKHHLNFLYLFAFSNVQSIVFVCERTHE